MGTTHKSALKQIKHSSHVIGRMTKVSNYEAAMTSEKFLFQSHLTYGTTGSLGMNKLDDNQTRQQCAFLRYHKQT